MDLGFTDGGGLVAGDGSDGGGGSGRGRARRSGGAPDSERGRRRADRPGEGVGGVGSDDCPLAWWLEATGVRRAARRSCRGRRVVLAAEKKQQRT